MPTACAVDGTIAGLSDIHHILQKIFGVTLPDAKVVRTYNEDSDYGCVVIQVYFYDEDANFMNAYTERPVSDSIELWFYNNPLFMKEQLSKDILQYVDINYRDWRTEEGDQHKQNGTAEILSLQEAEALLKKDIPLAAIPAKSATQFYLLWILRIMMPFPLHIIGMMLPSEQAKPCLASPFMFSISISVLRKTATRSMHKHTCLLCMSVVWKPTSKIRIRPQMHYPGIVLAIPRTFCYTEIRKECFL